MTTGHVYIGTSLDGFIARPEGEIDWLEAVPVEGEDHGYDAFMAGVDGLIIGRGTYETALGFGDWPYHKPVVVLSRSLRERDVPRHLGPGVWTTSGDPDAVMAELAAVGWRRAYVDGGQVIQSFLRAGLIADMVVTRLPILIGQGRPIFGELARDIMLKHVETRAFPSGLVQSRYSVAASTAAVPAGPPR